jgi:hypothetical protein
MLDQPTGPLMQFPQSPRRLEWLLVIAQVMQHGSADIGHGKAAQGTIPLEIEGFHRPDQPQVAGGHQLLKGMAAVLAEAVGHLAHQGQVVAHQRIAPMQTPLALLGIGHGLEPLAVAGAQLLCIRRGEGHGTKGAAKTAWLKRGDFTFCRDPLPSLP